MAYRWCRNEYKIQNITPEVKFKWSMIIEKLIIQNFFFEFKNKQKT